MKIGDLLKDLANKIGKTNDPAFVDLFTLDAELPDDTCNAFIGNLMSLEHAKSKLKGALRAETLNGVDAKLVQLCTDLGLSVEFDIDADSFKKMDKFRELIKAELEKKPEKSDESSKLAKQRFDELQELKQSHAAKTDEWEKEKNKIISEYESRYVRDAKFNALRGKNWANKNASEEENIMFANMLIDNALKKDGAKEVYVDGRMKLVLENDHTSPFFDEKGVTVSHEDFVNKVIAEKNLIAVTEFQERNNNHQFQPEPYAQQLGQQMMANTDPVAMRQRQKMNEAVNKTLAAFEKNNRQ